MNKIIIACLVCLAYASVSEADFPIPLSFNQVVHESTIIVQGTAIRVTPLVPEDDNKVPAEASRSYLGPRCFTFIRIHDVWKKHPAEDDGDDSFSPYDGQGYLTVIHGNGHKGIRGISHELTEGRTYVLFLKMVHPGLYRLTDCNSAYTVAGNRVPRMGVNLLEADVVNDKPIPVPEFKLRVAKELARGNRQKVSGESADE